MPSDGFQGFRGRRHPAASRPIRVNNGVIDENFEYAVVPLDQFRTDAERIGRCFRQTGGSLIKASLHTVMDFHRFMNRFFWHTIAPFFSS